MHLSYLVPHCYRQCDVVSWKLSYFEGTAEPPNIHTEQLCWHLWVLFPAPRGASVPHLKCRPAQSCAMITPRSAVCCPVSLCYRHPVLELLNNSPGDKDLSMCHMRALSLNWGLKECPRSSLCSPAPWGVSPKHSNTAEGDPAEHPLTTAFAFFQEEELLASEEQPEF